MTSYDRIGERVNMKSKRRVLILSGILLAIILYLIFYNKTYSIKIEDKEVYEIKIQTPGAFGFGLNTKTITKPDEITLYLDQVLKLRFTHPKIDTGKGWITAVDIKYRSETGKERMISYTILEDKIEIGSFQYDIISQ